MPCRLIGNRGQAATEFMLVLAIIVAVVAYVALPSAKEAETTLALAGARSSAFSSSLADGAKLTEITESATGPNDEAFTIHFSQGVNPADSSALATKAAASLAQSIGGAVDANQPNCARGAFKRYCVSVG